MRSKSSELMKRICEYVESYVMKHGESPSMAGIGEAIGISKATAYRYLVEMDKLGLVSYDGKGITTERTKKLNQDVVMTPLVGSVPCGTPQYEEENIEEYIALPTAIACAHCVFGFVLIGVLSVMFGAEGFLPLAGGTLAFTLCTLAAYCLLCVRVCQTEA